MGLYGPIATIWNGGADQLKFPADQLKLHGCVQFTKETCVCGFKCKKNGPSDQSEMTQDQSWPQDAHVCFPAYRIFPQMSHGVIFEQPYSILIDNTLYIREFFSFLLVWSPRFQILLIMGWCESIPEHRLWLPLDSVPFMSKFATLFSPCIYGLRNE